MKCTKCGSIEGFSIHGRCNKCGYHQYSKKEVKKDDKQTTS